MRMLTSMGWQEGKGIGKNGTGIVKHIHAKKRALNSGIGADARADASGKIDWTLNAVSFDNILKGLTQTYAADQVVVDEAQPTEQTPQEVTEKTVSRDLHKNLKVKEIGRSTVGHAGRYRKRESNKRVKNYSTVDLDAILGGISGFSAVPPLTAEVPVEAQEPGTGMMREETVKAEKSNRRSGKKSVRRRLEVRRSLRRQRSQVRERSRSKLCCHPLQKIGGAGPQGLSQPVMWEMQKLKTHQAANANADLMKMIRSAWPWQHMTVQTVERGGSGVGSQVLNSLRVADVDRWKGQRVRFDEPCEEVSTVTKERAPKKAKKQKKEKKKKCL